MPKKGALSGRDSKGIRASKVASKMIIWNFLTLARLQDISEIQLLWYMIIYSFEDTYTFIVWKQLKDLTVKNSLEL